MKPYLYPLLSFFLIIGIILINSYALSYNYASPKILGTATNPSKYNQNFKVGDALHDEVAHELYKICKPTEIVKKSGLHVDSFNANNIGLLKARFFDKYSASKHISEDSKIGKCNFKESEITQAFEDTSLNNKLNSKWKIVYMASDNSGNVQHIEMSRTPKQSSSSMGVLIVINTIGDNQNKLGISTSNNLHNLSLSEIPRSVK